MKILFGSTPPPRIHSVDGRNNSVAAEHLVDTLTFSGVQTVGEQLLTRLKNLGTPQELITSSIEKAYFLGDGSFYHGYGMKHSKLADVMMLFPAGRENRILTPGDEVKKVFDKLTWDKFYPVEHLMNHEEALGLPLLHNPNLGMIFQRRVHQPSVGSLYQESFEKISPIWSAIRNSTTIEEFEEKVAQLLAGEHGEQLAADYFQFQKDYDGVLTMLAEAPQEAYNEAARLMSSGSGNRLFMDFDHANNVSFNPKKQQFEFYDFHDIPNPFLPSSTIDEMMLALLTNKRHRNPDEVKRFLFLLRDPQFKDSAFDKVGAAFEKVMQAEEKYQTIPAYNYAARLFNEDQERRMLEQQAQPSKWQKFKQQPLLRWLFK